MPNIFLSTYFLFCLFFFCLIFWMYRHIIHFILYWSFVSREPAVFGFFNWFISLSDVFFGSYLLFRLFVFCLTFLRYKLTIYFFYFGLLYLDQQLFLAILFDLFLSPIIFYVLNSYFAYCFFALCFGGTNI